MHRAHAPLPASRLDMRACHPASKIGDRGALQRGFHAPLPISRERGQIARAGTEDKSNVATAEGKASAAECARLCREPQHQGPQQRSRSDEMFRPSDLQLALLHAAAIRSDGLFVLPSEQLGGQAIRIRQSLLPLLKNGLAIERPAPTAASIWRDKRGLPAAVSITPAGRQLAGVETTVVHARPRSATESARPSKIETVVRLLQRHDGASIAELMGATGWKAHSARAAVSSLRRRGHDIVLTGINEDRRYRSSPC
jgi:hypothetical protein